MPPALRIRRPDRSPDDGTSGGRAWLPGPPLRLPAVADRVAEGWWRLTPRARTVLTSLVVTTVLGSVLLRVALSPYGPPVPVLVTTTDLAVGTVPGTSDVTAASWPRDLLPPGPPATREDLGRARLTTDVAAGTVLTRGHLRDDGPLADLAAGSAAVPAPVDLLQGVGTGARLDLITVAGDGSGRDIARDVRVLAVEGDTVWLEVPRDRAADVAAAVLRGTLSGAVLPR